MQPDKTDDIIALIDEQLEAGEVKPATHEMCPHCGHDWHGLECGHHATYPGPYTLANSMQYRAYQHGAACGCKGSHQDKPPRYREDGRKLNPVERAYTAINNLFTGAA